MDSISSEIIRLCRQGKNDLLEQTGNMQEVLQKYSLLLNQELEKTPITFEIATQLDIIFAGTVSVGDKWLAAYNFPNVGDVVETLDDNDNVEFTEVVGERGFFTFSTRICQKYNFCEEKTYYEFDDSDACTDNIYLYKHDMQYLDHKNTNICELNSYSSIINK